MAFSAGPYTAQWNSLTIGQIEDGFTVEHRTFEELVTGDNEGRSPQDAVFQGKEAFCEFILMEAELAGVTPLLWPEGGTIGNYGQVGRLAVGSSMVKTLVLTVVSGTPAATTGPASLTATRSKVQEGFAVRTHYGVDLRDIPVRMRFYAASGVLFALA